MTVSRLARLLALIAVSFALQSAWAQGGPPMVTDDPETPGDGHWEINMGTIGARTSGRWEVAAPDMDINYGWGEHVQLKVDAPWLFVHESGEPWKSGLGAPIVGVKWRFIDIEDSGFSMSTYPQYTRNWLPSSARRGISDAGGQFFLPLEVSTVLRNYSVAAETGVNLVQYGSTQWIGGAVVAHACGPNLECIGELRETLAAHESQTLVNLGMQWRLKDSMTLLAAVGREVGTHADDQQSLLFYLGVQFLK
jgi:hypothetical protein